MTEPLDPRHRRPLARRSSPAAVYLLFFRRQRPSPRPIPRPTRASAPRDSLLAQLREHAGRAAPARARRPGRRRTTAWSRPPPMRCGPATRLTSGSGEAAGRGRRVSPPRPRRRAASSAAIPSSSGRPGARAVVIFFGALGLWLAQEQKPRAEAGETGHRHRGPRRSVASRRGGDDPDFSLALARVRNNPGGGPRPHLRGDPRAHPPERLRRRPQELNDRSLADRPLPPRDPDAPGLPARSSRDGGRPGWTSCGGWRTSGPMGAPRRLHLQRDAPPPGPAGPRRRSRTSRATSPVTPPRPRAAPAPGRVWRSCGGRSRSALTLAMALDPGAPAPRRHLRPRRDAGRLAGRHRRGDEPDAAPPTASRAPGVDAYRTFVGEGVRTLVERALPPGTEQPPGVLPRRVPGRLRRAPPRRDPALPRHPRRARWAATAGVPVGGAEQQARRPTRRLVDALCSRWTFRARCSASVRAFPASRTRPWRSSWPMPSVRPPERVRLRR